MASISTTHEAAPHTPVQPTPLSASPPEGPGEALSAYRQVLAQLDAWCATHDSPRALNSWVAEEAVRQSW